jgi:serine/threonine protein phosphatase 1
MRTFAIGDIHGCLISLETLLSSLELKADDQLIFLGDYVDRGPQTCGVIERLISLSQTTNAVFLRGNHDDWMLDARTNRKMFNSWLHVGGKETLQSYGTINLQHIPSEHFDFLEQTRVFYETEYEIFAHASVSYLPLELNTPRLLMWGNLFDIEEHSSGKRIIVGHSSQNNGLPLNKGFVVCVDTHCYGGGWLTALDVYNDHVYQANEDGKTRQFALHNVTI